MTQPPDISVNPDAPKRAGYFNRWTARMTRDRLMVVAYMATSLIAGLLEPFTPSHGQFPNEVTVVHSLANAVLLFAWCKAHVSVRRVTSPVGAALLVALMPPVGLPYYYFRAFPWRSALVGLGKALVVLAACILLHIGGLYVGLQLAA